MRDPRWGPGGRQIAFSSVQVAPPGVLSSGDRVSTVWYDDGSCVTCSGPIDGVAPVLLRASGMIGVVRDGSLLQLSVDGRARRRLAGGGVSAGAVSPRGGLVVVRRGRLWIGPVGDLVAGPRGTQPEWSPDGEVLAYVSAGHIDTLRVRDGIPGASTELVAGSSPSWSPDGRQLAYVAAHHRVRILQTATGRSQAAGGLRGRSVSWGAGPPAPPECSAPAGSRIIATTSAAVLALDGGRGSSEGLFGCLIATGQERVLLVLPPQPAGSYDRYQISSPALAGSIAGVISSGQEIHYGGESEAAEIFNLNTGLPVPHLGGQSNGCPDYDGYGCQSSMNDLVVNQAGDSAVHIVVTGAVTDDSEAIAVSDSEGQSLLDPEPYPSISTPPAITALTLTGDTLSWDDDGQAETAQLR